MVLTVEGAVAILTGFSAFVLCMRFVVKADIENALKELDQKYMRKDTYEKLIREMEEEIWPHRGQS